METISKGVILLILMYTLIGIQCEDVPCREYTDCQLCEQGPKGTPEYVRSCAYKNENGDGICKCRKQGVPRDCKHYSECIPCNQGDKGDRPVSRSCANKNATGFGICRCIREPEMFDCQNYEDCKPCPQDEPSGILKIRTCANKNAEGFGHCKCENKKCKYVTECPMCNGRDGSLLESFRTCRRKYGYSYTYCRCEMLECEEDKDCPLNCNNWTSEETGYTSYPTCRKTYNSGGKKICTCSVCDTRLRVQGVCPECPKEKEERRCEPWTGTLGICSCFKPKRCQGGQVREEQCNESSRESRAGRTHYF